MKRMKILFFVVFFIWFFLPLTLFYGEFNKVYDKYSDNSSYKVVAYYEYPVSPYSIYRALRSKNYFFILYDKCDNIVFKPSIYYGVSDSGIYGGIEFVSIENKLYLYYPDLNGNDDSFEINTEKKSTCH